MRMYQLDKELLDVACGYTLILCSAEYSAHMDLNECFCFFK